MAGRMREIVGEISWSVEHDLAFGKHWRKQAEKDSMQRCGRCLMFLLALIVAAVGSAPAAAQKLSMTSTSATTVACPSLGYRPIPSLDACNNPGCLDATFGGTGTGFVRTDVHLSTSDELDSPFTLAQAGKYLLPAGTTTLADKQTSGAVLRYTEDGVLDASYGSGGVAIALPWDGTGHFLFYEAAAPDGSLLAADDSSHLIVRLTPSGQRDTNFGSNGVVSAPIAVKALLVQNDGKILAGGSVTQSRKAYVAFIRLNADGTIDGTFGKQGQVVTSLLGVARALALQTADLNGVPDTRIIAVTATDKAHLRVLRLGLTGAIDTTFGGGAGYVATTALQSEAPHNVLIDASNRIVVSGTATCSGTGGPDFALYRFTPDGVADVLFGNVNPQNAGRRLGYATFDVANTNDRGLGGVALQADGKLVLAGDTMGYWAVLRFNSDGTIDSSFNGTGMVLHDFEPTGSSISAARGVVVQTLGDPTTGTYERIVAAGQSSTGYNQYWTLVRYVP